MQARNHLIRLIVAATILLVAVSEALAVNPGFWDWTGSLSNSESNAGNWSLIAGSGSQYYWDEFPDMGPGNYTVRYNADEVELGRYISGTTNYHFVSALDSSGNTAVETLRAYSATQNLNPNTSPSPSLTNAGHPPVNWLLSYLYGIVFFDVSGSGTDTFDPPIVVDSNGGATTGFIINQNSTGTFTINGSINGGNLSPVSYGMNIDGSGNTTIAGAISNTFVNMEGTGTLTLSGVNTYSGGTNVFSGLVRLTGNGTLGNGTGSLNIYSNATLDLGGTTQLVGQVARSGSGNGVVGTIQNGTLNIQTNGCYFQSGTLSANLTSTPGSSGRLYIGGDSTATVYLGGVNSIQNSGNLATTIGSTTTGAAGIVELINAAALGLSTQDALLRAGTLDLNGQPNVTVGTIRLTGGSTSFLVNNNTSTTATFAGNLRLFNTATYSIGGAGNLAFSGPIVSGDGSVCGINIIGPGTVTLTGSNTYSGGTVLSGGALVLGNNNALGAGQLTLNGGTLQSGISLSLPLSNPVMLTANSMVSGGNNVTISGPFTNSGQTNTLTNAVTSGTLTLSGNIYLSETPSAGRLLWIVSDTPNTTTVLNGEISDCIGGGAGGTLDLAPRSSGDTIVVNASNSFTGGANLGGNGQGCIVVNNNSAFGTGTVGLNKTILQAGTGPVTLGNTIVIGGSINSIVGTSGFAFNFAGAVTNSGGDKILDNNSNGLVTLSNNVYLSESSAVGRTLTLGGTGNMLIAGVIANCAGSGGSAGSLAYNGSGVLVLSGNNTYSGNTTVSSGTLQLGNGSSTNGSVASNVILNGGALKYDYNAFCAVTSNIASPPIPLSATSATTRSILRVVNSRATVTT